MWLSSTIGSVRIVNTSCRCISLAKNVRSLVLLLAFVVLFGKGCTQAATFKKTQMRMIGAAIDTKRIWPGLPYRRLVKIASPAHVIQSKNGKKRLAIYQSGNSRIHYRVYVKNDKVAAIRFGPTCTQFGVVFSVLHKGDRDDPLFRHAPLKIDCEGKNIGCRNMHTIYKKQWLRMLRYGPIPIAMKCEKLGNTLKDCAVQVVPADLVCRRGNQRRGRQCHYKIANETGLCQRAFGQSDCILIHLGNKPK
jgi:hypothetical protein